jgi:hypothetical protein
MISFSSRNIDGKLINWQFNEAYEIEDEFWGDADLPANDDEIFDLEIDSVSLFIEGIIGTRPVFLDLVHLLGIEQPESML